MDTELWMCVFSKSVKNNSKSTFVQTSGGRLVCRQVLRQLPVNRPTLKRRTFPLTIGFSGKPREGPPILSPIAPNAPETPPNGTRTKINYLLRATVCFGDCFQTHYDFHEKASWCREPVCFAIRKLNAAANMFASI
jgi:hypothetical protein